jgi:hypothetical protein
VKIQVFLYKFVAIDHNHPKSLSTDTRMSGNASGITVPASLFCLPISNLDNLLDSILALYCIHTEKFAVNYRRTFPHNIRDFFALTSSKQLTAYSEVTLLGFYNKILDKSHTNPTFYGSSELLHLGKERSNF